MNISTAWAVLGKSWEDVVRDMTSLPSPGDRVRRAEELLVEARRLAKRLLALNHPDRNPGDPEAATRFKTVSDALSAVESDTAALKHKYEEMKARAEKRAADGFIIIR